MANLKLKFMWNDGVYQLEETDPVVGGENGIDNLQARQLAENLFFLKTYGIAKWSDKITYAKHSIVNVDAELYVSLVDNNISVITDQQKWSKLIREATEISTGVVKLNNLVTSISKTEAATAYSVNIVFEKAKSALSKAEEAETVSNSAKSEAKSALSKAEEAETVSNSAKDEAAEAIKISKNAIQKNGDQFYGALIANCSALSEIVASNRLSTAEKPEKAVMAHQKGQWAIFNGNDGANLRDTSNLTFASWYGIGFAPLYSQKTESINNTVVINTRKGIVESLNGFIENGIKLLKKGDFGIGAVGTSFTNNNIDNVAVDGCGFYNVGENTAGLFPDNFSKLCSIINITRGLQKDKKASQIIIDTINCRIAFRTANNSDFGNWFEFITTENIKKFESIGFRQKWQDVTDSRMIETVYTNTTSKPIMINIIVDVQSTNYKQCSLLVDNVIVSGMITSNYGAIGNARSNALSAIIPPGSIYMLTADSFNPKIHNWSELR